MALGRITGSFGSRYFLLMAGAGLDANIVYEVSAGLKKAAASWPIGSPDSRDFSSAWSSWTCRIDNVTHTCGFALVSRVRNYGGDLEIASGASLHDDISRWFYSKDRIRCATLGTC